MQDIEIVSFVRFETGIHSALVKVELMQLRLVMCLLFFFQYLKFEEFEETIESFDKDCKGKGKLVSEPQGANQRDSKIRAIQVNDSILRTC